MLGALDLFGVVMTISGDMSMKVPRNRSKMLIIKRMISGFSDTNVTHDYVIRGKALSDFSDRSASCSDKGRQIRSG